MAEIGTDEVIFQEEPRRYIQRGRVYGSVTEKIKAVGFGPDFSRADPMALAFACERGKMVDLALTYFYEGDLDPRTIDPRIRGYFDGAMKFDRDCPGTVVSVHPRVCSAELNVAGTLDIVRFVRHQRAVIDWKTGADNPLQTCMYFLLWNLMKPRTPVYARYGLKLNVDGTYRLKEHNNPYDIYAVMAILKDDKPEIERWRPHYGHLLTAPK